MAERAIILFAHGSRDADWALPFRKIQRTIARGTPGARIELAFLEIMEPSLADAVAKLVKAGHNRITVAPLFLAQGGHLKQDVPKIIDAIRAEHRGLEITLLPAIGDVDAILDAIADWLISAVQKRRTAGTPRKSDKRRKASRR